MIIVSYNIALISNILEITATFVSDITGIEWYFDEGWGEDLNSVRELKKIKNGIVVKYAKNNSFYDDRDFAYPYTHDNYFIFQGLIGLPLLSINESQEINVKYKSNIPLYISSIGKISNNKLYLSNFSKIKSQLFVGSHDYVCFKINSNIKIYFTFYEKSHMFISKSYFVSSVVTFLKKCYTFFSIEEKTNFVVNYIGTKLDNKITSTGHGGFGSLSGFNYFIMFV